MIKILKNLIVKIKYRGNNQNCQKNNIELIKINKINFKGENYFINGNSYYINNLEKVEYGLAGKSDSFPTCYIKVYTTKGKDTFKYNGFEVIDLNSFIYSMDEFKIPILPTILNSSPYIIKSEYILAISFLNVIHGRGLIKINKEMIYKDNDFLIRFNLKKYLDNSKIFNDNFIKYFNDTEFNITIFMVCIQYYIVK